MKQRKITISTLLSLFLVFIIFQSCGNKKKIYILIGEKASQTEELTASFLLEDLKKVSQLEVSVIYENEDFSHAEKMFILGTPSSCNLIQELTKKQSILLSEEFPGKRGGIWALIKNETIKEALVLAGSDVQGMQYAVYDYCKEILDIDPFEYWSGKTPDHKKDIFAIQNKVIPPPEIPILCYFENDVDELANIKKPMLEYDWVNYTQMINSLVRIKYNAIHFFDMLGRPEFFLRPEYKAIRPDYNVRLSYIDSMINYAHDMGMQVQIDMALGYIIKPMDQDMADCWRENKQEWIDTWKYYMEETPIGKADIFSLRPRNQVWDWEYKSSCGEDKIEVFNEVYSELGKLIDEYKPGATKVAVCYHDGMEMFNNGFNPPKDWIVAWSDNGWAGFNYLPEDTKGYNFGTYMHAGFWRNHTVHDPYPEVIDSVMKMIINEYGANKYCLVNGQQFRPFLLNLEAFSKLAEAPDNFSGEQFYTDWASYYLGPEVGKYAVASMKKLHQAHFNGVGYVQHLWEIREAIAYLSNTDIKHPGKADVPYEYSRVQNDFEHVTKRLKLLDEASSLAKKGYEMTNNESVFYHDYILLPIEIYRDLLIFETALHKMTKLKKSFEVSREINFLEKAINLIGEARENLETVGQRRISGDINPTWEGWYNPENRRPNNGFPTQEMLNAIETNLKELKEDK